jgi:hypothetical protein
VLPGLPVPQIVVGDATVALAKLAEAFCCHPSRSLKVLHQRQDHDRVSPASHPGHSKCSMRTDRHGRNRRWGNPNRVRVDHTRFCRTVQAARDDARQPV